MAKKLEQPNRTSVKIPENKPAARNLLVAGAPLIVIVGPTASGKTALAVELAQQFNGEIICADSRTIYKYMDIGTAKPNEQERAAVPHWGLDLVEPGERFTAADFKAYAIQKIAEIRSRGKVPFLVGGTGLYVDSVVFDYQFGGDINTTLRKKLEKQSIEDLQKYCLKSNIELPENVHNKRHLIRTIERKGAINKEQKRLIKNCIVVGIATDNDVLRVRIERRSEQLFANRVVEEASTLGKIYGWESEAMTGNVYPIAHDLLDKKISLNEAKDKFTTSDWKLAKRQMTWFRRNKHIYWCGLSDARIYLQNILECGIV